MSAQNVTQPRILYPSAPVPATLGIRVLEDELAPVRVGDAVDDALWLAQLLVVAAPHAQDALVHEALASAVEVGQGDAAEAAGAVRVAHGCLGPGPDAASCPASELLAAAGAAHHPHQLGPVEAALLDEVPIFVVEAEDHRRVAGIVASGYDDAPRGGEVH